MKQGKGLVTFVMVAIAVVLAVYLGFHVVDTFDNPYSTTLAYSFTGQDSAEANGILIRDEQVLTGQNGILEVTCREGEKVGAGQLIARIYRDAQAQSDYAYLDQLDEEIALLQAVAGDGMGVESAARLDEDILQSVVELRASVSINDFSELESQVKAVKGNVLKRGYTYGDGLTTEDLKSRLRELIAERNTQSRQFAGAATRVTARQAGTFSALVDGYEEIFTPENAKEWTVTQLREQILSPANVPSNCIGKMIFGIHWYLACVVDTQTAERLQNRSTIIVRFRGDFTQDVRMTVEQVNLEENGGEAIVVLSSDRYLARTTQLRQQTVELIFAEYEGLRVPKQAVRMEYTTTTDEETGEEVQTTMLGVYVLVGGRVEFKKVTVVMEGSDYYVLRPVGSGSRVFRAGDEVIVQAVGLQDGQLLEY